MTEVFCEYNNCNDIAKVMNNNIPYCINHYRKEKKREKKLWFWWIIAWLPGNVVYWGTGKTTKKVKTYGP